MTFEEWLAEKHPDLRLGPYQLNVARMMENSRAGLPLLIYWPRASGRTFLARLWGEYQQARVEGEA